VNWLLGVWQNHDSFEHQKGFAIKPISVSYVANKGVYNLKVLFAFCHLILKYCSQIELLNTIWWAKYPHGLHMHCSTNNTT